MAVITQTIRVHGMRCTNCENIVERSLKELRGVQKARADYGGETCVVTYDTNRCSLYQIYQALERNGYECAMAAKPRPLRDGIRKLLRIILGICGIIAIFYAGSLISKVEQLPDLGHEASIGLLFLAGLLTSFHCVGMCGGFVIGYSTQSASRSSHTLAHFAYGLGKTLSYTALGAAFGFLGSLVSFTPMMKGATAIGAGLFLVGFGLNMLHLLPHFRLFGRPMPRWLSRFVHDEFRKHKSPFVIGLLNGLMIACGPLQAMYVMAAGTGSPWEGARILLLFGAGTLPLLLGFGFLASLISRNASGRILKASGAIVVALGLIMFNRGMILTASGYDLASLTDKLALAAQDISQASRPTGNLQVIRTDVTAEGFEPSTFELRRGVKVRWIINVKELTECNRAIVVPKLGLNIDLHVGERAVEFTPDESGDILWSCWMGMLRGEFRVTEDQSVPETETPSSDFVGPLR